jgi:enoyl-CoA hydratase/crotonobetainyl-CoA hydratase
MTQSLVRYEVDDGVAVITIDRPEVRNAMNYEAAVELEAALDRLDADDSASVAILTGAGGMFCAGMDLKALSATGRRPIAERRGAFGITRMPPEKPVIAAVERFALGGGLEIALACDLIVVAEDAKLGLPEAKRGLVAAAGGVIRLPRRIPTAVALELALTGDLLPARRALELGLVSRVTAPGETLSGARELAAAIAANAPLAVKTAKRIIEETAGLPVEEAFARQEPLVQAVRESDDAREGAQAFVEKRAPVWQGR